MTNISIDENLQRNETVLDNSIVDSLNATFSVDAENSIIMKLNNSESLSNINQTMNSTFSLNDEESFLSNHGTPGNFKKLLDKPASTFWLSDELKSSKINFRPIVQSTPLNFRSTPKAVKINPTVQVREIYEDGSMQESESSIYEQEERIFLQESIEFARKERERELYEIFNEKSKEGTLTWDDIVTSSPYIQRRRRSKPINNENSFNNKYDSFLPVINGSFLSNFNNEKAEKECKKESKFDACLPIRRLSPVKGRQKSFDKQEMEKKMKEDDDLKNSIGEKLQKFFSNSHNKPMESKSKVKEVSAQKKPIKQPKKDKTVPIQPKNQKLAVKTKTSWNLRSSISNTSTKQNSTQKLLETRKFKF